LGFFVTSPPIPLRKRRGEKKIPLPRPLSTSGEGRKKNSLSPNPSPQAERGDDPDLSGELGERRTKKFSLALERRR